MSAVGAIIGAAAGLGAWWTGTALLGRRLTLSRRVAPYLARASATSRLLAAPQSTTAIEAVLGHCAGAWVIKAIDRCGVSRSIVQRRLDELGRTTTVDHFRMQQVVCAAVALAVGLVLSVAMTLRGTSPGGAAVMVVSAVLVAVVGWDQRLERACQAQRAAIEAQLAPAADLLALAVAAGLSPRDALDRVARLSGGQLSHQLSLMLADVHAGATLSRALDMMARRCHVIPLTRLADAMVAALERGTPLAGVLRDQARDVREAARQRLLREAGRREIAMLVPVVFLIMPVAVLFALYPGLIALNLAG